MSTGQIQVKHREQYIDAIKVFALLMVFLLHTQRGIEVTDPCHNFVLFYGARCAMPLFFMVNGALILNKDTFTWKYYKVKVFNILRLLVLWGGVTFLYFLILVPVGWRQALKEGVKAILGYQWVINTWFFMTFIIIYTILLFRFNFIKHNITKIVGVLLCICVIIEIISIVRIFKGEFFIQDYINQRFRFWTWFFYFGLGYVLRKATIKINKWVLLVITVGLTALSVWWQYYICWVKTHQIESNYMQDDLIIILWCICLFLCLKKFRAIQKISIFVSVSFGAFLLHSYFIDYFSLRGLPKDALEAFGIFIALVLVTFIISFILSKIPVVKWLVKY